MICWLYLVQFRLSCLTCRREIPGKSRHLVSYFPRFSSLCPPPNSPSAPRITSDAMEIEWDSRMNPHQPHGPPMSYTSSAPTTSMQSASSASSLSAIAQRRRSSAAHIRPAAPPPNLPIPSLPPSSTVNLAQSPNIDSQDLSSHSGLQQVNGRGTRSTSFNRPAASASLAAVANFSQLRQTSSAPASQSPLQAIAQADDLSDPPPPSVLPVSSSRMSEPSHESSRHTRHLSPPSTEHRPSSRRALTRALELAREAVQLDSTNEDPEAAVNAYAQSVALLSEVMERVRRGEDSTESRRGRRRRSVAAQEEEVRRLQNIVIVFTAIFSETY